MKCIDCKHWTVPTWPTNGFGTCYLNSYLRDSKKLRVLEVKHGEWITTHESFGCVGFEEKPKAEDKG